MATLLFQCPECGFGHHEVGHLFGETEIPGLAALHRERLEASVLVRTLERAALHGTVSFDAARSSVTFEWPQTAEGRDDAMFVFEIIGTKK